MVISRCRVCRAGGDCQRGKISRPRDGFNGAPTFTELSGRLASTFSGVAIGTRFSGMATSAADFVVEDDHARATRTEVAMRPKVHHGECLDVTIPKAGVAQQNRLTDVMLIGALFGVLSGEAKAANGDQTRATAALLMEADTGAILYQHNADELLPPASMSKLMTLAVAFRALKKGAPQFR